MAADREWTLPVPPDASVTAVIDRYRVRWRLESGVWWGDVGHGYNDYKTWPELLARGPLTVDEEDGR
jgi:hypothetical protein